MDGVWREVLVDIDRQAEMEAMVDPRVSSALRFVLAPSETAASRVLLPDAVSLIFFP